MQTVPFLNDDSRQILRSVGFWMASIRISPESLLQVPLHQANTLCGCAE